MSDRGMKKWAPYRALIEQDPAIVEMSKNKAKIDKPIISEEEAEVINDILINHNGRPLIATVYESGVLKEKEITIKRVDPYERKIYCVDKRVIPFSSLIKLIIKEI